MRRRRVLKLLSIFIIVGIILPNYSQAKILFEDNFDNSSDWQSKQEVWRGAGGQDIATLDVNCGTHCPPPGWNGYRAASSHWSDDRGQDTYILDATGTRGGYGKGITYWVEGATDHASGWSGGALNKWLGIEGYKELYIRYYLKYPEEWHWKKENYSRAGIQKLIRISSFPDIYAGKVDPMFFTSDGWNFPVAYFDWAYRPVPVDYTYFGFTNRGAPDYADPPVAGGAFQSVQLPTDHQWHSYEFHVKMNSAPGISDGMEGFYIDGELRAEVTGIRWRKGWVPNYNYDTCSVNKLNCKTYPTNFGQGYYYEVISDNGSSGEIEPFWPENPVVGVTKVTDGGLVWRCAGKSAEGWNWLFILDNVWLDSFLLADHVEMPIYMDDFVVSTEYIGPDYVIGGGVIGDINGDKKIDVLDVQMCVNIILRIETREEYVNKAKAVSPPTDTDCDVSDLQAVVNKILE